MVIRKSYLEKRISCEKDKMADVLQRLGYTQEKSDFYKKTSQGRLHVKLRSVTKNSCEIVIHHDLTAPRVHYTVVFDAAPNKAWKQIERTLFSLYGTSFEL